MRPSHNLSAVLDDPNLVSCGGLAPATAPAQRAGLAALVAEHLTLNRPGSANAHLKVPALVAGMVAGADSVDADALATSRAAVASGLLILRADSAYHGHDVAAAEESSRSWSGTTPSSSWACSTAGGTTSPF